MTEFSHDMSIEVRLFGITFWEETSAFFAFFAKIPKKVYSQPRSQGRHCLPLVIDVGPGTGCRKSGHLDAILFCIIYHLQTHYKLSYNIYSQNELNSMKHMPIDFDA